MSGEKATSPCSKFQANIFNKSKCQNCFKSRELHLLTDNGMEQAKPLYGGWLCLAPEGTDFDNPMQRSRKWQRRFFILYEDGSLSFALDELPSTLPQGTLNLNLCSDIVDAEPRTGQRNALCVATPQQEIFIRGDNKEIINGWTEQLSVFLRTNKQNQKKKKRKVEPVASQELSPAKMAATDPSCPSSGNAATWQQEPQLAWTVPDSDPRGLEKTPAGSASSYLSPASLDLLTCGSTEQPSEDNNTHTPVNNNNQSRDQSHGGPTERILGSEREAGTAVSRTGRSEARTGKRELQSCGDVPQRRAKSLDRRTSDTVMTPDLLNFKKGWMVKLDENQQWKKYWFVLSMDTLRCYKDSVAEEASDLDSEIDLTRCYSVSEYQVQRNYGFQIHTPQGVFTLSAMTSGIRRNWIQALMKNVSPTTAPDVTSLPGLLVPRPDVTQDSSGAEQRDLRPKQRSVAERRRDGRYKTFDWAEFRPRGERPPSEPRGPEPPPEPGELERRSRREERRRRYEGMLGFPLGWDAGGGRAASPESRQKAEEEMEECWRLVERTAFRLERSVPTLSDHDKEEEEELLDGYRKEVEDLQAQLVESERLRLEVQAQLSGLWTQPDPPLTPRADLRPSNGNEKSPREETRELLEELNRLNAQESPAPRPEAPPAIWLQDAAGDRRALPETEDAPPASEKQLLFPQSGGQTVDSLQSDRERVPASETQIDDGDFRSSMPETPSEDEDDDSLGGGGGGCVELHVPPAAAAARLSREAELLRSQNEALNQRNQEMLNQLTEADREIERLKAELGGRYAEPRRLPEAEQLALALARVEDLEGELSARDRRLLEAQEAVASLQESAREGTREPEEPENKGYLLRCFEATEAKLTELEGKLERAERGNAELRAENAELRAENAELRAENAEMRAENAEMRAENAEMRAENAEMRAAEEMRATEETRADVGRLEEEELEKARGKKDGESDGCVSGEERIRQVIDGMVMRLKALERLLEVMDKFDFGLGKEEEEEEEETATVESQLRWEEEFWGFLLDKLKVNPSELEEEEEEEEEEEALLSEVTERMAAEKRMLLLGHRLLSADGGAKEPPDVIWSVAASETDESGKFDSDRFRSAARDKISSLRRLAAAAATGSSTHEELQLAADRLHPRWSGFLHSAATEALLCRRLSRLRRRHQRRLEEAERLACGASAEENRQLRARLSDLEARQTMAAAEKTDGCSQTDKEEEEEAPPQDAGVEVAGGGEIGGEEVESPETTHSCAEGQAEIQETTDGDAEESDAMHEEAEPLGVEEEPLRVEEEPLGEEAEPLRVEEEPMGVEAEPLKVEVQQVSALRRRVEELEEQLAAMVEEMKEEHDGKMSSLQTQHEAEMEELKVTCERGFACVEECHLKVVEELQRRHRQEVERLLVERDGLLEEESAATATALEAIQSAHRLELQKQQQLQERRGSHGGSGDAAHLEDREELASCLRELEVLSQQFSLKCLENVHLVQALDAERKALSQCQQENQDLSSRNQELSGHLAAEITRLCSLAPDAALPPRQSTHLYQVEITLRVKESEVQRLKQEIASLRDDLQAAQRDKRSATKRCNDTHAQLSVSRAKAERDTGELRENLRLARRALHATSP